MNADAAVAMLTGATITHASVDAAGYAQLTLEKAGKRFYAAVQADPEGNGPGTLFVVNGRANALLGGR